MPSAFSIPQVESESELLKSLETLTYLEKCVKSVEWKSASELMEVVKNVGKSLLRNSLEDTVVHSTILRFMKLIREESIRLMPSCKGENEKLQCTLVSNHASNGWCCVQRDELFSSLMGSSYDLKNDIKNHVQFIASSSLNFIHSDELILTVGYSKSVLDFLKYAANKRRQFRVIVCEAATDNRGHEMAKNLDSEEIPVILIPDSHVFALMARVNKVILSCKTVYPDGSMKAQTGTYAAMLAAKHFSIPTYVCLPSFKISPLNFKLLPNCSCALSSHAQCAPGSMTDCLGTMDLSVDALNPNRDLLPASERFSESGPAPVAWTPRLDYIPPGLTSLFLTSDGGQAPTYLYAMVRDLYSPDDVNQTATWFESTEPTPTQAV